MQQSRTNPGQRLDESGNPVNLFELLKKDPKAQGYRLEKVYFLELDHGLMAFFPAVIHTEKRVVICLDRSLLIEIWKTLDRRASKMGSSICFVNEQKGLAYTSVEEEYRQEHTKPEKILMRAEYEKIRAETPDAIGWAFGLLGGTYFEPDQFLHHVDEMAASCK